ASAKAAPRHDDLVARFKAFSSQPLSLESFRGLAMPFALIAVLAAGAWSTENFWLGPTDDALASSVSLYQGTLAQSAQKDSATAKVTAEPVLWARDILSLAGAMPYDMRLTRIQLVTTRPGTPPELQIT